MEIPVGFDRESGSDPSSETSPTDGGHLVVREVRGGAWDGPGANWAGRGERKGPCRPVLGRGERERKKGKRDWAGLEQEREEERFSIFL